MKPSQILDEITGWAMLALAVFFAIYAVAAAIGFVMHPN